jgi:hypothetical protein
VGHRHILSRMAMPDCRRRSGGRRQAWHGLASMAQAGKCRRHTQELGHGGRQLVAGKSRVDEWVWRATSRTGASILPHVRSRLAGTRSCARARLAGLRSYSPRQTHLFSPPAVPDWRCAATKSTQPHVPLSGFPRSTSRKVKITVKELVTFSLHTDSHRLLQMPGVCRGVES